MRAVLIKNPGPNAELVFVEQHHPPVLTNQILVEVKAFALNRADLMQRFGNYPPPPGESNIPGLEASGLVVDVGVGVTNYKIGDRVYGLVGSGAYANYCPMYEKLAAPIPSDWSYEYAAAIPEALTTANATVFNLAKLQEHEVFLVHAAGSGISTMAIQMAKNRHAEVISTASSSMKIEKALALGANQVINYKERDFCQCLQAESVDVILDYIGKEYFAKHLSLLRKKGRLVQIASLSGRNAIIDLIDLMRKRLQINGFVLRAQTIAEKAELFASAQSNWRNSLINQQLKAVIDSVYPFSAINEAQQYMLTNQHFGKIVVRID